MSEQVVGFFSRLQDAEQAAADLIQAGFKRNAIHTLGREGGAAATTTTSSQSDTSHEGETTWQRIKDFFGAADESDHAVYHEAYQRGTAAIAIDAASNDEVDRITQILNKHNVVDIDKQAHQWRQEGWKESMSKPATTTSTSTSARTAQPVANTQRTTNTQNLREGEVIPVIQEQIQVGKRQVRSGGIRIYSRVTEKPITEQVQLHEEHVHVERRPVDRPVGPNDRAFEERSIEATEMREEPIVKKEARVVEEVVVRKDADDRTETVKDTVRRTDVQVEKVATGQQTTTTNTTTTGQTKTTPPTTRNNP